MTATSGTRHNAQRAAKAFERAIQPLYGTDVLLAIIIGLSCVDISVQVAGFPLGLGDALLFPVLFIVLLAPGRPAMTPLYAATVSAYLLWSILALGWTNDRSSSLGPLLQYVEFFLLVPLAFSCARNMRGVVAIVRFYVICASTLSLAVLIYAVVNGSFSYVYFLNYQKNYLGAITGNALPLIIGLLVLSTRRRWIWVALALNVATLLLSSSRGSMLGAIIGIAVFLLLIRRIWYGLFIGLGGWAVYHVYTTWIAPEAASSLVDFSADSSAGSRLIIFEDAMRVFAQSPYVGHGVGSYLINIPSINFQQRDPSNVFLLNMVEVGVVGLCLFIVLLIAVGAVAVRNCRRLREHTAAFTISAALAGGFAAHLAHIQIDVSWVRGTGTFMFACVGLLLAVAQISKTTAKSPTIAQDADAPARSSFGHPMTIAKVDFTISGDISPIRRVLLAPRRNSWDPVFRSSPGPC